MLPSSNASATYDAVVVGGGHNGLVAAAYLARAGRRVAVLERQDHAGGAAVSAQAFAGVDARLSRYSYLVSLLPKKIISDLGLTLELRRRRYSSYTPYGDGRGLLVDNGEDAATAAGFRTLTGGDREFAAWQDFYGRTRRVAESVFPTLTEPLPERAQLRKLVADAAGEETWEALFERPIGEAAARLTIHPNTLKYRLRRAGELFGIDLDHPDDRLSCWLQLRMSR